MTISRGRLPSIAALQAFEAAALRMSFAHAAADLNVSAAAISQQIRSLELQLGVKLFGRTGRGVRLTETGKAWLPEVRRCLERIRQTAEFAKAHASNVLSITVAPSFASRWLMGRLYRFNERHPEISVRLIATPEVIDLRAQDVDIAIRFGPGGYRDLEFEQLLTEFLVPMCAPGLMKSGRLLRHPNDLKYFRLIHDDSVTVSGGGWPLWLKAVGADEVDATKGSRYSLADIALQEAINGRGIVLARWHLAVKDVREGRLVCPFDLSIECPYSYFFVTQIETIKSEKIQAFRDWLHEEISPTPEPEIPVVRL